MGVLLQRILTGAALAAGAAAAVFWLATPGFALAAGAVILGGAWEWARLCGWESPWARSAYVLALAGVMLATLIAGEPGGYPVLVALGLGWWLVALGVVVRYQRRGEGLPGGRVARALAGALTLVPAWAALVDLHGRPNGAEWLLLLALVTWGADTAAFFVGRRWGRRRLASRVSPGKSWEGVGGGVIAALAAALAGAVLLGWPADRLAGLAVLASLTAAASVLGDLSESLFKREAGVKDSGQLLPGHGGLLDRIDSLTAAAPIFAIGLRCLAERS
jgi:phosphatidate cytidylyltransferase